MNPFAVASKTRARSNTDSHYRNGSEWLEAKFENLVKIYPIKEKISDNMMTRIYKGKLKKNGSTVAIKKIFIGKEDRTEAVIVILQCVKQIDHPNIMPIYDCYADYSEKSVFFTMDFGKSLEKELDQKHRFTTSEISVVLTDILEGLWAAFQCNLLHLNIKTTNIIKVDGVYKVSDWESAVLIDTNKIKEYKPLKPFSVYTLPELRLERTLNFDYKLMLMKADMFSIGIILLKLFDFEERYYSGLSETTPSDFIVRKVVLNQSLKRTNDANMQQLTESMIQFHATKIKPLKDVLAFIKANVNQDKEQQDIFNRGSDRMAAGEYDEALKAYESLLLLVRVEASGKDTSKVAEVLFYIGLCKKKLEKLEESLEVFQKVVTIRESILGDEHADTAEALHELGTVQLHLEKYGLALLNLRRALDIRRTVLGPEARRTSDTFYLYGICLHVLGKPKKHLKLLLNVSKLRRRYLGESALRADSTSFCGIEYFNIGKYDKAAGSHSSALEMKKMLNQSDEDLSIADSEYFLSLSHQITENHEAAIQHLFSALKIRKKVLGESDPYTVEVNLAIAYSFECDGQLEESKRYLKNVCEVTISPVQDTPQKMVLALYLNGIINQRKKNHEQGLPFLQKAVDTMGNIYSTSHPFLLDLYHALAISYLETNHLKLAGEAMKKAIMILDQVNRDHPRKAELCLTLGMIYERSGQMKAATGTLVEGLEVATRAFGGFHRIVAEMEFNFGMILARNNERLRAITLFKSIIEERAKIRTDRPLTYAFIMNLAIMLIYGREYQQAIEILQKNIKLLDQMDMDHSEEAGLAYHSMGVAAMRAKQFRVSQEYFLKAIEIRKELFGVEGLPTAMSVYGLGVAYFQSATFEKALECFILSYKSRKKHNTKPIEIWRACCGLTTTYLSLKSYEKALMYMLKTADLEIRLNLKPECNTADNFYLIGVLSMRVGRETLAIQYFTKAKELFLKDKDTDIFKKLSAAENIALCHEKLNNYAEAIDEFLFIVKQLKSQLKPDQFCLGSAIVRLGDLCKENGDPHEALAYYTEAHEIRKENLQETHKLTKEVLAKIEQIQEQTLSRRKGDAKKNSLMNYKSKLTVLGNPVVSIANNLDAEDNKEDHQQAFEVDINLAPIKTESPILFMNKIKLEAIYPKFELGNPEYLTDVCLPFSQTRKWIMHSNPITNYV